MAGFAMSVKLPLFLRHPDPRFAEEPAIWHVLVMTAWGSGLLPRRVSRWVARRWVKAIARAANARREAEEPIGDI